MDSKEKIPDQLVIQNYEIVSIKRSGIEIAFQKDLKLPYESIAQILPYGEPQTTSIKYSQYGNYNLLTTTVFDFEKDNGFSFIYSIENSHLLQLDLENLIRNVYRLDPSLHENKYSPLLINTITSHKIDVFPKIPNLDGLLFSLLGRGKIIIYSSNKVFLTLYHYFQILFPEVILRKITFVSQSNSLLENVQIIGLSDSEKNAPLLNKIDTVNDVLWIPNKNKLFAPKTSNMCKKLAMFLNKGEFEIFRKTLDEFILLIEESSEFNSLDDIIENLDYDLDDAQFFMAVQATINDKEFDFTKMH